MVPAVSGGGGLTRGSILLEVLRRELCGRAGQPDGAVYRVVLVRVPCGDRRDGEIRRRVERLHPLDGKEKLRIVRVPLPLHLVRRAVRREGGGAAGLGGVSAERHLWVRRRICNECSHLTHTVLPVGGARAQNPAGREAQISAGRGN